jgi:glucose/mannose-6-phosphate isomerase
MRTDIKNFPYQFEYEPQIVNAEKLRAAKKFIVVGMGGSHLAADLIKLYKPALHLDIHKSYTLPKISAENLTEHLVILSSYSGNTEEVIDAFGESLEKNLNMAAITTNGKLMELAKKYRVPYIQLPDTEVPPRLALGLSVLAHLKLLGEEAAVGKLHDLATTLDPEAFEERGKRLAEKIQGKIPIIYASAENAALAYNWKIKFNETGKIPAFQNVFPELNHNEMQGFDTPNAKFGFIFLEDKKDHHRIQKRMAVTKRLFAARGFPVIEVELKGKSLWQKIFDNLLLADWASYYTAVNKNAEPSEVPMIEEFKKLLLT